MIASKCWMGLFSLGLAGMLNAAIEPTDAANTAAPSAATLRTAPDESSYARALQTASGNALLTQIRRDLQDGHASLHLAEFRFEKTSGRSLEGSSKGLVLFDRAASIPIVASVTYDIPSGRVERAEYTVNDSLRPANVKPLAKELRERIADQIGSRLVMEFAQQPVDFSLLTIGAVAEGTDRMFIDGSGISRFAGEGSAFTRFTAVTDKATGRVLALKYELLQQIDSGSDVRLAQESN